MSQLHGNVVRRIFPSRLTIGAPIDYARQENGYPDFGAESGIVRARMLYDPAARKKGSVVQQKAAPVEESPVMRRTTTRTLTVDFAMMPRVRYVPEVIGYGAHIPTLERLADEGHFD